MQGYFGYDVVCPTINTASCGSSFLFAAVTYMDGLLWPFDGILGMWSGSGGSTSGLLVPYLFREGFIGKNMFSFYLTNKAE